MSHLLKNKNPILKILRYIFYLLLITSLILITYLYEGNKIYILIFGIITNFIFYFIFSKRAYFFEIFFGILLWLGFWYKTSIIILKGNYMFREGAGSSFYKLTLEQKLETLDSALIVAIFGITGFLIACFIKNFLLEKYFDLSGYRLTIRSFKNSNFLKYSILIFFAILLIITSSNFFFGIYQRGILATTIVHPYVSSVFKWLLLFGFSSFIAYLYLIFLNKKISIYMLSVFSIVEPFLSNLSILSRGMIFNCFAIFIGIYKSNKFYKLNLNIKYFIIFLIGILIFFYISVVSVNYLRANFFFNKSVEEIPNYPIQKQDNKTYGKNKEELIVIKKYNTLSSSFKEFMSLTYTRWVGIDALIAVKTKKSKSFQFFKNSFNDKFDINTLPFYEREVQNREIKKKRVNIQYGITTPGIVAFLYYTGSKVFVTSVIFLITISIFFFERYIFKLFNNYILCSLLSQVLAYRLIHFGYMPQNTYLLLSSILITLIGLIILEKFFVSKIYD